MNQPAVYSGEISTGSGAVAVGDTWFLVSVLLSAHLGETVPLICLLFLTCYELSPDKLVGCEIFHMSKVRQVLVGWGETPDSTKLAHQEFAHPPNSIG